LSWVLTRELWLDVECLNLRSLDSGPTNPSNLEQGRGPSPFILKGNGLHVVYNGPVKATGQATRHYCACPVEALLCSNRMSINLHGLGMAVTVAGRLVLHPSCRPVPACTVPYSRNVAAETGVASVLAFYYDGRACNKYVVPGGSIARTINHRPSKCCTHASVGDPQECRCHTCRATWRHQTPPRLGGGPGEGHGRGTTWRHQTPPQQGGGPPL
jgi:hypothetical protein